MRAKPVCYDVNYDARLASGFVKKIPRDTARLHGNLHKFGKNLVVVGCTHPGQDSDKLFRFNRLANRSERSFTQLKTPFSQEFVRRVA